MINFIVILLIALTFIFLRFKYIDIFNNLKSIVFIIIIIFMVFSIVIYPEEIIEAAHDGILLWANVVLPSLLPFFIGAEILVGLGVVKFIGILIEPLVRPIFNVPGEASFVFAMSITSGYPMGVKLTSNLRKNRTISKTEAQRIISFCSTSGPLFMIGSVSIGMFNNPNIGPYIVMAHYLSAITVGIIFRFIYIDDKPTYRRSNNSINIFKKAIKEMLKARQTDGRSIGKLLSDSVKEAISTLVLVGGMIVTFSVITKELYLIGFFDYIVSAINFVTHNSANIPKDVIEAILTGSIEITMGCKIASEALLIHPITQITLATMIISWSGFSIHAQSASMLNETDINMNSYMFSKLLHSIISGIYVLSILKLSNFSNSSYEKEVFYQIINRTVSYSWTDKLIFASSMFIIIFIALLIISFLFALSNKKNN